MERTANIIGISDFGGRRSIRRFITRLCEHLLGVPLEAEEKENTWWSDVETEPRAARYRSEEGPSPWRVEQREFYFDKPPVHAASPVDVELPAAPEMVERAEPEVRLEKTESERLRPGMEAYRRSLRREESTREIMQKTETAAGGKNGALLNVSRFLKLHGTLGGGPQVERRFTLPKGRFEARCRLWNDPSPFSRV